MTYWTVTHVPPVWWAPLPFFGVALAVFGLGLLLGLRQRRKAMRLNPKGIVTPNEVKSWYDLDDDTTEPDCE